MQRDREMPLAAHLDELRARVMRCVVAIVVILVAAWVLRDRLMTIVARPHMLTMRRLQLPETLAVLSYQEGFLVYMKLCLIVALFVGSPYIIYQIWAFVSVGLYPRERRWVHIFGPFSALLFLAGVAFGYFVLIPLGLRFLLAIGGGMIHPNITLRNYLSLVLVLTLMLGVVFEMPLVMLFLARLNIITPQGFRGARRFAILIIVIIAAVVTPTTDPFTQFALALPMFGLYELGIFVAEPTWRNFLNVVLLALVIASIPIGVYGWQGWRAGRLGVVTSGTGAIVHQGASTRVAPGQTVPRGAVCSNNAEDILALDIGREAHITLNRAARIVLLDERAIRLEAGEILARCGPKRLLRISTEQVDLALQDGEADVSVVGERTVVIVRSGSVSYLSEGRQGTIRAGRRCEFATPGEPIDVDKAPEWMRQAPGDPAQPGRPSTSAQGGPELGRTGRTPQEGRR